MKRIITQKKAEALKKEQDRLVDKIADQIVENIINDFQAQERFEEYCKFMDIYDTYREDVNQQKSTLPDFSSLPKEMQHLIYIIINDPEKVITKMTDSYKIGLGSIERFLKRRGYNQNQIKKAKERIKKCLAEFG